jgi:Uma2 family endonuclease
MSTSRRWTSADLEVMPDDGKRYEIIDGELYVSKQPNWNHQIVCLNVGALLREWSKATGLGLANGAPGLVFADDDEVAPDVIWISRQRLSEAIEPGGHLRVPPEIVVEVLSPGSANERRDLQAKLKLYSRRGVDEYWIVDWRDRSVRVYRRDGEVLDLVTKLGPTDSLRSPVLPGFDEPLSGIFEGAFPFVEE